MVNDEETEAPCYSYQELKEIYEHVFNYYEGVTDEEFEAYMIEHFGEERLNERK